MKKAESSNDSNLQTRHTQVEATYLIQHVRFNQGNADRRITPCSAVSSVLQLYKPEHQAMYKTFHDKGRCVRYQPCELKESGTTLRMSRPTTYLPNYSQVFLYRCLGGGEKSALTSSPAQQPPLTPSRNAVNTSGIPCSRRREPVLVRDFALILRVIPVQPAGGRGKQINEAVL